MVSITTTIASVKCPELVCAGCGGQTVTATYGPKTVRIAPCESLRAQGWRGEVAVTMSHNQALEILVVA